MPYLQQKVRMRHVKSKFRVMTTENYHDKVKTRMASFPLPLLPHLLTLR